MEVRLDSIGGEMIAQVNVPHTGGWENWLSVDSSVDGKVKGVHDVYFVFRGRKGCKLFNFDSWGFSR